MRRNRICYKNATFFLSLPFKIGDEVLKCRFAGWGSPFFEKKFFFLKAHLYVYLIEPTKVCGFWSYNTKKINFT